MLIDKLINKQKNIIQRTYFWNLAANVVYSIQSALLLIIVTRFGGLVEAGVFSIIYANTHMLAAIGNYNMRNFQVSDARNEYGFRDYWTSRVISCEIMIAAGCVYAFANFRDLRTISVVLFFVGYRVTDAIEDVVHGLVQKEGRLDVAAFARTLRIVIASAVFIVAYIVTGNLLLATLLLMSSSMVLMVLLITPLRRVFSGLVFHTQFDKVWKLLWVCLPICLSAFLQSYIVNSPKYAIDSALSSEVQAVFNILFMPIFAINVLSMFIFHPLVANMGVWWNDGDMKRFRKSIALHVLILSAITVLAAAASYLCGCELLGLVYGVNLTEYKALLMVLMLFGGVGAMATYFSVIVTIMRKQNTIIIAYAIASVVSVVVSRPIVTSTGINGAAILYGLLMTIVMLYLLAVMIFELRKHTQSENRQNGDNKADE